MLYIVSGFRRSGTSAMMQALGVAGIPLIHIPEIDKNANVQDGDYKVNPPGLFEISRNGYMNTEFMQHLVDNRPYHAVKVFYDGLPTLPPGDYYVIFMTRNSGEIADSCLKAKHHVQKVLEPCKPSDDKFDVYRDYNQAEIDEALQFCKKRSDMEIHTVDYADLIDDPLAVFEKLNILQQPQLAAASIDAKLYRSRR